jgi:hypothetical protein
MSLIRVVGGPHNAHTDPETGARTYQWRGRELPSVTTILRLAGVPERLHAWALSRVVDRAIEQAQATADRLRDAPLPAREAARMQIRAELLQAVYDRRDRAATLGTAVHAGIASGGMTEGLSLDVQSRVRHYNDWLRVSDAEVLASEFQVWNLTHGYAGTADLLVRLRDGSQWVLDIKTGRSIKPNHALQLAAYAMAEFVGADGEVDDRLTGLLSETRSLAVMHLTEGGWEFRSIPYTDDLRDAFLGLLQYVSWNGVAAEQALRVGARRSGAAPPAIGVVHAGYQASSPALAFDEPNSELREPEQALREPVRQCAVCGSRDVLVDPVTSIDPNFATGQCRTEGRRVAGVMTFPVRPLITAEYAPNAQRQIEVAKAARQRVADGRGKGSRRLSPEERVNRRRAVQAQWDQEAEVRRNEDPMTTVQPTDPRLATELQVP